MGSILKGPIEMSWHAISQEKFNFFTRSHNIFNHTPYLFIKHPFSVFLKNQRYYSHKFEPFFSGNFG